MSKVTGIFGAPQQYWVGDGFPVRSLFSHATHGAALSPFLLLDYAGPAEFQPAASPRGVGAHPHRGFETVTIVYDGEVEHRDSTGAGGIIGPGDVQWMTAAGGIVHAEFHSQAFTRAGGRLEMVQLWVNLPARSKDEPAGYQSLLGRDIPVVDLPGGVGRLRVIAGEYAGRRGPARSFTPIDLWDLRVAPGGTVSLPGAPGRTAALVVLEGDVALADGESAGEAELVLFDRAGGEIALTSQTGARALFLGGEPIDEPVVMHGPFVMNTTDEIRRAVADFRAGRFGALDA
jgi:redox-sensitive bicupin YhaK (pirin superfamily)